MNSGICPLTTDGTHNSQRLKEVNSDLSEMVISAGDHVKSSERVRGLRVHMGIRELPEGEEVKFNAGLVDTLCQVFRSAANTLGKPLLPFGAAQPLDILRYHERYGNQWSEPLTGLEQPLWLALARGCTHHLGIEYVLAVKINTSWGVAPAADSTPRELLTSFGFDPSEFSLYRANSADLLSPDIPLTLKRGDMFDARKVSRYERNLQQGSQPTEDDPNVGSDTGITAYLFVEGNQRYVEVSNLPIPSPPWSRDRVNIVIAIPATYPAGGLDAFYLEQTVSHESGSIPHQQGTTILDDRSWVLVSWHYPTNRPWNPHQDDIASHLEHCRGYFLRD